MNPENTFVKLNQFPKDKYNVLIPVTSIQIMSEMQRLIVNEVSLNTDVTNGGDIYYDKSSKKYAITKVGGLKLAAAANISIVSSESVTPDVCRKCVEMSKATGKAQPCGTCPHQYDVKFIVKLRVPEPSGGFRIIEKSKEIDCAMEKESMKPDQYKRFLPHRASICESKALMRAIRDSLGLKAGYTMDELKNPFIIAHIVPNLDSPEIRNAIASSYLDSMGMLFERSAGQQKQLTAGTAPQVNTKPPETPEPPDSNEPPYHEGEYTDHYEDDGDNAPLPWDMDNAEIDGEFCEDCGTEIEETQARNGQIWSVEAIKGYSIREFGSCLCPDCQHTRKAGR